MNVNLHCNGDVFNTGLLRITGSCNADACLKMIQCHLDHFNVSMKSDIVAIVLDGAAMIIKVGKNSGCLQQTCIAHSIHLAVVETFYDPKFNSDSGDDSSDLSDAGDESNENFTSVNIDFCTEERTHVLLIEVKSLLVRV